MCSLEARQDCRAVKPSSSLGAAVPFVLGALYFVLVTLLAGRPAERQQLHPEMKFEDRAAFAV
jgi:hypothetical protein